MLRLVSSETGNSAFGDAEEESFLHVFQSAPSNPKLYFVLCLQREFGQIVCYVFRLESLRLRNYRDVALVVVLLLDLPAMNR